MDLSTHTPPTLVNKKAKTADKVKKKVAKDAIPTNQEVEQDQINLTEQNEEADDEIQVLNLHTHNPTISYKNQVYTCHWATDIGTTLFFSPSTQDEETSDSYPPLRSFTSFDLLAKSRTRLVAIPTTLKKHSTTNVTETSINTPTSQTTQNPSKYTNISTTVEGDTIYFHARNGISIKVPPNASAAKLAQAKFLEKWSQLSRSQGRHLEEGPVPVTSIRTYNWPEGWKEERKYWLQKRQEEEEEEDTDEDDEDGGVGAGRKKRRRRRTRRVNKDDTEQSSIETNSGAAINNVDMNKDDDIEMNET